MPDRTVNEEPRIVETRSVGRRRPVWPVALAILAGGVLAACGGPFAGAGDAPAADAAAVVVLGPGDLATAVTSDLEAAITLTGSLRPYREVEVFAQVPGTVAGLEVDRGDSVRAGAVLATIEADGIRSEAAGARAAVAAAESQLALARRQLESARMLHGAGALADLDLQGAVAAHEAARAQVAAARAQAASAGEAASRTRIVAPVDGIVSDRSVDPGEAVAPGQALLTVVDGRVLELAGQVPVEAAPALRPGLPVVFELRSEPGVVFQGAVDRVDPVADPATRQVGIHVRLPNPGARIVAGQFATGRIIVGRTRDSVVVPEAAVREGGEGHYVVVVDGGRVARRQVETGGRDEARGLIAIRTGLRPGERVLSAPGVEPPAGTPVRIDAGAPAGAPHRGEVG